MVSQDIQSLISDDIKRRREEFMRLMQDHGKKSRDEILESVRETQDELMRAFRSCAEPRASRPPAEGEWCLRELAMHAAFTERLVAQLVHHLARGTMPPPEAFVGAAIGMMPEDHGRPFDAILRELADVNEAMLTTVGELPDEPNTEMKLPHPFFGPLNSLEWAGFQRVHDLDHIQHARKILAAVSA